MKKTRGRGRRPAPKGTIPQGRPSPPLATAELRITEVGFGGWGIGRVEGKIWMVPFCLPGERVRARALRERRDYVEGALMEVIEAAPERVQPPCRYFGVCGGCAYQHATYERQVKIKQAQVAAVLERFGSKALGERSAMEVVRPTIAAPVPLHYRNRITVHVKDGKAGFYRWDGRGIVAVDTCLLADAEVAGKLAGLVARSRKLPDGPRTLRSGRGCGGFVQTNPAVAELLRRFVAEQLATASGIFLDLYGGSGFFAEPVSSRFEKVYIVDWSQAAAEEAKRRALPNWQIVQADVESGLAQVASELPPGVPVWAVVDPPAQGLSVGVVQRLAEFGLAGLIYVSCNPSTFARDAARLHCTYRLMLVQPFDMFAQTAAVELAAVFLPTSTGRA